MNPRNAVLPVPVARGETPRALCLGLVASDFLVAVPFPIERDVKFRANRFVRQGGGPAANAAVALARLGVETAFVGAVGDDGLGREQREALAAEGISVDGVRTEPRVEAFVSFILVDPSDGARTIFSAPDQRPRLPRAAGALPEPGPHLVLVDGWDLPAQAEVVARAHERGIPVLLDAGSCRPDILALVPRCDVVIASEPFAEEWVGAGRAAEAVRRLLASGPRLAAVTRGASGVLAGAAGSDDLFEVPAFPIDPVDTTGAGDAFHGGAAWALLEGRPWGESLECGAAVAALKCLHAGARAGLPDRVAVEALLADLTDPA